MKIFVFALFLFLYGICFAQKPVNISVKDVQGIINFLASDKLKGRGNGTKELQIAGYYIADAFKKDSLQFFPGFTSYFQPFSFRRLSEDEVQKDSAGKFLLKDIMFNVIGVLPGKTKANEAIIFSAHYDHWGVLSPGKDTINNGANDNASGTTALLALAQYFAKRNDNTRTIIFCAFAGEEVGLVGSKLFSKEIEPENIIANINLEMVGRSMVGNNAFFVTGAHHSNLSSIFKKNLAGTPYKVVREPDESRRLFERSDNYFFAAMGIPAHSIMCSDDSDPCYHQPCDEVNRINIINLTNLIKAIAIASSSIVEGRDTPTRINTKRLK